MIHCGAVQSKFWGQTQCIFAGPLTEIHYLEINDGGYCSEHEHKYKWNRFFVIDGTLRVTIYRDDGEDTTTLTAGQFTDVPPGVFHKFEALSNVRCLETYWVNQLNTSDINRRTVGGENFRSDTS